MKLDVGHRTEAGSRPENQDAVLAVELDAGLWLVAVADGMGGLGAGAQASQAALAGLERAARGGWSLEEAFQEAHEGVRAVAGAEAAGSTLVAALVSASGIQLAHVGDSRAYQFGPMGLVPLTRDHTVAADAEARGDLAAREVAGSRWGKTLSRSLGRDGPLEVATQSLPPLEAGSWLVLTSDGVHGVLDTDGLEGALQGARSAGAAAGALVERALAAGSRDNVAAAVIHRPREAAEPAPPPSTRGPLLAGDARPEKASWDPRTLVARSHNPSPRRPWRGPGILATLVMVALLALLFLLLL